MKPGMSLRAVAPDAPGCHEVLRADGPQGLRALGLDVLNLAEGQAWEGTTGCDEIAFVAIECDAELSSGSFRAELKRKGVFVDGACAAVVPPNHEVRVRARAATTLALCRAKSSGGFEPFFTSETQGDWKTVGRSNYERRVLTLLGPKAPCRSLVLGETYNPPGNWSSFPPHKHDRNMPGHEAKMEEIYYFRIDPPTGFGFQRVYTADRSLDQPIAIDDGVAVAIPYGYHPVCAMPGHRLYYLWFLAGVGRDLVPFTDPGIGRTVSEAEV